MKKTLLLALWLPLAIAQTDAPDTDPVHGLQYAGSCSGTTDSGYVMSIAVPTAVNSARRIYLDKITIYPTASIIVEIRKDATTNPSSSTTDPAGLNTALASVAKLYCGSNVGSGTLIARWPIPGGTFTTLDMAGTMFTSGIQTKRNLNIHFSSVAGSVYVTPKWKEK